MRELLISRKQTIAVAESVTAGFLQSALALAQYASEFFQGGITVYNLNQKVRHLSVDPVHAMACNCVSEEVAAQMAGHVSKIFNSDWGLAITGYSSPIPEKNIYDLYACYAIYFRDKEIVRHTITSGEGAAPKIIHFYAEQLFMHFEKILCEE